MSLIAHYKLNGNADDALGRYNGVASTVTWVDGKIGQAANFSGVTTSNIVIENDFDTLSSFSVSAWFNVTNVEAQRAIFGKDVYFLLRVSTLGNVETYLRNDADAWVQAIIGQVPIGEWVHVVSTYDTVNMRGYINGEHISTKAMVCKGPIASNIQIGRRGVTDFFLGSIDDVRIYDHALSLREVRDLSHGLVLHIKSNTEIPADCSGQSNQIVPFNTINLITDTPIGKGAYEFLSSGYMNCGYEFNSTQSQTIMMWIKPYKFDLRRSLYHKNYGGEVSITVETNGRLKYYYGTSGKDALPYQQTDSLTSLVANVWTHVCLVRDLDAMTVTWFFNGVQTFTQAASYTAATASIGQLQIGDGFSAPFNGSLADIRHYETALSIDEINEIRIQKASMDNKGNLHVPMLIDGTGYQYSWNTTNPFTLQNMTSVTTNGVLKFTSSTNDPIINMANIGPFDPLKYKYIQIRYKILTGANSTAQIFFYNTEFPTASGSAVVGGTVLANGIWNTLTIDMSGHAKWDDTSITGWRLDPTGLITQTMEIEWVRLVESPNALIIDNTSKCADISEVGITNGLIAYYPLNKNTKDYAGNFADGTVFGASLVNGGYDGTGTYRFVRASSQYISLGLDLTPKSAYTKNVWVKTSDITLGGNVLSGSVSEVFYIASGLFGVWNTWSTPKLSTTVNYYDGNWHMLTCTYANGIGTLYFDGVFKVTGPLNDIPAGVTLQIGRYISSSYFDGDICNVKIFNRALTAEEVAVEYKQIGTTKMMQLNGTTYLQGSLKETV